MRLHFYAALRPVLGLWCAHTPARECAQIAGHGGLMPWGVWCKLQLAHLQATGKATAVSELLIAWLLRRREAVPGLFL